MNLWLLNMLTGQSEHHVIQNGTWPHQTVEVFDFLNEYFNNRVIALDYVKHKQSGMDRLPYSPDLHLLGYYSLGGEEGGSSQATNYKGIGTIHLW